MINLNHKVLIEMEMVVECLCLSVRICPQNLMKRAREMKKHLSKIGKNLDI